MPLSAAQAASYFIYRRGKLDAIWQLLDKLHKLWYNKISFIFNVNLIKKYNLKFYFNKF